MQYIFSPLRLYQEKQSSPVSYSTISITYVSKAKHAIQNKPRILGLPMHEHVLGIFHLLLFGGCTHKHKLIRITGGKIRSVV